VLRSHDRDLHVVVAHLARLAGGHERQLVGRQRPHGAQRYHDRHPLGVALVDVAQQPAVDVWLPLWPPRRGAVDAGHCPAARRKEQRVEALGAAVAQPRLAVRVVGPDDRIDDQFGTGLVRDPLEGDVVGVAQPERLGHGQRAIGEVGVRGDQAQRHALARHGAEREQSLQAGDAAAGNDDVHGQDDKAPSEPDAR
jgi:hypothetical protein